MKRRKPLWTVAAVALTGALAMLAAGVASGAGSRLSGTAAISVTLSVKGSAGGTVHKQVGRSATLVAQATKVPAGDHLVIEGKQKGQAIWFKVASCTGTHCTGSRVEKKPATDVFQAAVLHGTGLTGAAAGRSKAVTVIWQTKTVLPSLSIADASTPQGSSGGTLSFTVTLSAPVNQAVSVDYATADGNAKAGNDYAAANGTLSIPAGQSSGAINVTITPDASPSADAASESAETFTVGLSNPVAAKIARGSATGTISNDDPSVRSGAYNGTTSQGKALTFNVSADGTTVSGINTTIDLNCTEVQGFTVTLPLTSTGSFPINSDLTFDANEHDVGSDGTTLDIKFHGQLTASSGGSGTLRVDVSNIPGVPGICSTGDTTWTAS